MGNRVAGKVAVVVGAGQLAGANVGNGRAAALLLAREGAKVLAADRDVTAVRDLLEPTVEEYRRGGG